MFEAIEPLILDLMTVYDQSVLGFDASGGLKVLIWLSSIQHASEKKFKSY